MAAQTGSRPGGVLGTAVENLISSAGRKAVSMIGDRMGAATQRLTGNAAGTVKDAVPNGLETAGKALTAVGKIKKMFGGGGGKGGKLKVTNIVESIDVAVPLSVAYNQWTQFGDFPGFMKKVEAVNQEEPPKLSWKAQIFWSHRSWESDIVDQVPDQWIIWRSQGEKGHPDGAVTFHELAPNLTRIVLVIEYYPQGLFERTGNLWRAQGRRVRLELKHFARHVMTDTLLHPQDLTGWRGEIHDGEVTAEPEEADEQDDTGEDQEEVNDEGQENDEGDENHEGDEEEREGERENDEDEAGKGERDEDAGRGRSGRSRKAVRR